MSYQRRGDVLSLTRAGEEIVDGNEGRLAGLIEDADYHFGDRLEKLELKEVPTQGQRLDERYLQFESVGSGGLGSVWRGAQLSIDRPVAIKTLDGLFDLIPGDQHETVLRRLEMVIRDHARLISPFIVQILDQNPRHEPPYFVMELAQGGNLRRLLSKGPLAAPIAIRYLIQISIGLQAAHAEGLLHRDLRPENVLFDENGNIKLSDFGITRVAERDAGNMRQAYVGYGSVGYMAPENFRRGARPQPNADIYSLGILLYEMLVGELPGRRSPMPSEVAAGVPQDLDELFDVMTQDYPDRRPGSIEEVLEMIWRSDSIVALLDPRQAPLFSSPPLPLPGLESKPTHSEGRRVGGGQNSRRESNPRRESARHETEGSSAPRHEARRASSSHKATQPPRVIEPPLSSTSPTSSEVEPQNLQEPEVRGRAPRARAVLRSRNAESSRAPRPSRSRTSLPRIPEIEPHEEEILPRAQAIPATEPILTDDELFQETLARLGEDPEADLDESIEVLDVELMEEEELRSSSERRREQTRAEINARLNRLRK